MNTAPLTHSQMMIWMGQQINPNDPLYNMILTFEFSGEIDVDCFVIAFQKLVDYNDVLRVSIKVEDGMPVQLFKDSVESPLEYIDFSKESNPLAVYNQWVSEHKMIPFGQDVLLYHAVLFKISQNQFIFYLNQHHLITDGWAMKFLYDQLAEFYENALGTKPSVEREGPQFETYANENPFKYETTTSAYWKNKQANLTEKPSLYGKKITQVNSDSTRVNFDLGKKRTDKLKAFAQEPEVKAFTEELTLSNIFLTVISTLIHKVGNQENFAIGTVQHNRLSQKDRKTNGLFMELLPLNISIVKEDSFIDVFKKVQRESLNVFKNAMIARPPIELMKTYNVLFNFIPVVYNDFAGIPTDSHWLLANHVDPNHHIRLQIHDFFNKGTFQLQFDLNNSVFSKEQLDHVGQHFVTILDAFIAHKEAKVKNLSIVSSHEVEKLNAWNNTDVYYDTNETLLDKFEMKVLENPGNSALVFGEVCMSYLELSEKANQVAHYLIRQGVGRNDIVALSLDRSFEMMVFLYGILKAGAAYLPLDTASPKKRVEFILKSSGAKVFFHQNKDWAHIENGTINNSITDELKEKISSFPVRKPKSKIHPNDLAYVIYTSGSTGEPKGVMCHHKGICNRLNWVNQDHPISANDVFIQKTPITFDVSSWEIFWPLQNGVKLIIERPNGHLDPEGLIKTINAHEVSMAHFVPSMLNVFAKTKNVTSCKSLRKLFCSGEAISAQTINATHEKLDVEIFNFYGPTEAAVEVSSFHCKRGDSSKNTPIGFPGGNIKLHILDETLNQVPIGVIGELYIAGVQVAYGYMNREDLTDERFLNDPFSTNAKAKMYRTGDLARHRDDGAIEYLGRVDTQIKLHGLRIELGEIEKSLESHTGIDQVVVKVVNQNEHQHLAAYYTGETIEDGLLKTELRKTLPNYMVPSFFIHITNFEFTTSGKIDRKKLPKISFEANQEKKHNLEPTNELEEIILDVWKEIIHVEDIGIKDNFTRIGGNSLNAMAITSRLKEAFELDVLSLVDVFNYPTIAAYAKYVEDTLVKLMQDDIEK